MDYLEFYQLKEFPFSTAVDSKFYYNSKQHGEAIVRVKYAIDTMKGLAVVVGDIGTGKTTLARRMLDELGEDKYEAALLVVLHSSVTSDWMMKKIASQIGVDNPADSKVELLGQVYQRLTQVHEKGLKTAVLIDEAQMLRSKEIMEEFRGLLNMEASGGKLMTFILFGLPDLEDILSLDEPLKQRVAVKCRMKAFEESVTKEYIQHRLKIAGSTNEVFTSGSIHAVHHYSQGVPRLINTVCDNALLEGFLVKKEKIDKEIVDSVVIGLGLSDQDPRNNKKG
jgi:type II secretory pathway predicted ATPase ExeA